MVLTMSNRALDRLIWTLIFGGILILSVSLFVARGARAIAWTLGSAGALAALAGPALIVVRSRRSEAPKR
jgi:hypothetical protein